MIKLLLYVNVCASNCEVFTLHCSLIWLNQLKVELLI